MFTRIFAACFALFFSLSVALGAETIVVNTTSTVFNPEDGLTTLPEAVNIAHLSLDPLVTITFNILDPNPETPEIEPFIITLQSPLFISRQLIIDGTTQPGYVAGSPIIQISRQQTPAAPEEAPIAAIGFVGNASFVVQAQGIDAVASRAVVDGSGVVFRGLSIINSPDNGIYFIDGGGHVVEGCFIGLEPDGDAAGNAEEGIYVGFEVTDIRIGTNGDGVNDANERNVISSNGFDGIYLEGALQTPEFARLAAAPLGNLVVRGNYIGTSPDGNGGRGNGFDAEGDGSGIWTERTSVSILNNVVSDNNIGIYVFTGAAIIQGNIVGLNAAGTDALGNEDEGILIEGFTSVLIGTDADGTNDVAERNVISGNYYNILAGSELFLRSGDTAQALPGEGELIIDGNYIGLNAAGTAAALVVDDKGRTEYNIAASNWLGSISILNNVISGAYIGVLTVECGQVAIQGNLVGLNAAGDAALPSIIGIGAINGRNLLIGTNGDGVADASERNVVSGHVGAGIVIENFSDLQVQPEGVGAIEAALPSQRISGNYIGTNAAGTAAIGNGSGVLSEISGGIVLASETKVIIGTDGDGSVGDAAEGNVISGNQPWGLLNYPVFGRQNFFVEQSVVAGNIIGLNATGTAALPNGYVPTPEQQEQLSGVPAIAQGYSSGIFSIGGKLRIGTDANLVSDALERNIVSANIGAGILFFNLEQTATASRDLPTDTPYNSFVRGNYIGTAANGTTLLPNSGNGITVYETALIKVGGTEMGAGNTIAGNGLNGIQVSGNTCFAITIASNSIGANGKLGIDLIGANDGPDGVTPNDSPMGEGEMFFGDPDSGPNSLTNFPVLATVSEDRKTVTGTLNGQIFSQEAGSKYLVQIFGNPESSKEEGAKLLGSVDVTLTDTVTFNAPFSVALTTPAVPGSFLTATATRLDFFYVDTSEFAAPLAVPGMAFEMEPTYSPQAPTTDDTVSFTARPNLPGLTIIWNFGDGTPPVTGESVTHVYGIPGVYEVTVTLLDEPTGTSITRVMTVTVVSGAKPAPPIVPDFRVRILNIKLGGAEGTDFLTLQGLLNVPKNFSYAGQTVEFNIGGIVQAFTLDAKGKAKSGLNTLKMAKASKTRNQERPFTVVLKKGSLESALRTNAVVKDANGLPTELTVTVRFNNQNYNRKVPLKFKTLKSGATSKFGVF